MVERLGQTSHDREVLGSIPAKIENIFPYDSWKIYEQLKAEAYLYVMINEPMTCRTLNRQQSLMVGPEPKTSILNKKINKIDEN